MIGSIARSIADQLGYALVPKAERAAEIAEHAQLRERLSAQPVATSPAPPPPASAGPFDPAELLGRPLGYPQPAEDGFYTPIFSYDGLLTDPKVIHNHDFMRDPRYIAAARKAEAALGHDHRMFWRLHVALWCATQAARLPGDFVECGVWRGYLSTAIVNYLPWPVGTKSFYLFDTYDGLVEAHLTDAEKANRDKVDHLNRHFANQYDHVVANFAPYPNIRIVKGTVPETLSSVDIAQVCYLSLDLNCAQPERAAAEFFWERMPPGAPILLDDYGFVSYEEQKRSFDDFARHKGVEILALPTGQGLIIHP